MATCPGLVHASHTISTGAFSIFEMLISLFAVSLIVRSIAEISFADGIY
jgi:hypothetical protein